MSVNISPLIKIILESKNNRELKENYAKLSKRPISNITDKIILSIRNKIKSDRDSLFNVIKKIQLDQFNGNDLFSILKEIYREENDDIKNEIIKNIINSINKKETIENESESEKKRNIQIQKQRELEFPTTGKFKINNLQSNGIREIKSSKELNLFLNKKGGSIPNNLLFPQKPYCLGSTTIIRSHGKIIKEQFDIPKNVNIITLKELGNKCPLNPYMDMEIFNFYESGNTIFEDNDKSYTLTYNGKRLQDRLNNFGGNVKFEDNDNSSSKPNRRNLYSIIFKNHVGPIKVNNFELNFTGIGCTTTLNPNCAIDCINNKNGTITTSRNIIPKWHTKRGLINVENIKLNELIGYNGYNSSYIVIACRGFDSNFTPRSTALARSITLKAQLRNN
jgi:hypothetical protein